MIALLLICLLNANAQSFNVHNLDIEDGLSNNYIRTIFKDSQGLIWFGTDTGLDSYDGLQIINYARRFRIPAVVVTVKVGALVPGNFTEQAIKCQSSGCVPLVTSAFFPLTSNR